VSAAIAILGTVVPAYLIGAMPWGLWISRLRGVDIRRRGSGNLGATNVYRQLGPAYGIAVLILDIFKGVLAVSWGKLGLFGGDFPGGIEVAALAAGLAAISGHIFTVFAGFRGGKGVATTVGVFLALTPKAMLAALVVWIIVTWITKRVSAGSLALAAVYPIGIYLTESGEFARWLLVLGLIISVLIVIRHLDNIKRLVNGTEPPFALRGRAPDASEEGSCRHRGSLFWDSEHGARRSPTCSPLPVTVSVPGPWKMLSLQRSTGTIATPTTFRELKQRKSSPPRPMPRQR